MTPITNYDNYEELIESLKELGSFTVLEHSGKFKLYDAYEKFVFMRKDGTINLQFLILKINYE